MQPDNNKDTWQAPEGAPAGTYVEPDLSEPEPETDTAPIDERSPDEAPSQSEPREGDEELVRWQAMEYIHREKDPLWYVIFAVVVLGLVAVAIFLVNSWTFAVLIPVMAATLVVYSMRPPSLINYTLSRKGLHVNDHLYNFVDFREFGLVHDDEAYSIMLMPRKRFQPGVTVYFPEEAGEAIVDMLAARLPMRELKLDLIDRLIRKLRI